VPSRETLCAGDEGGSQEAAGPDEKLATIEHEWALLKVARIGEPTYCCLPSRQGKGKATSIAPPLPVKRLVGGAR
jgi:hypothetical protein